MFRTIRTVQYKTILSDLWITSPFVRRQEFAQTKPRLTFGNLPGKVGAGATMKLKVNSRDFSSYTESSQRHR